MTPTHICLVCGNDSARVTEEGFGSGGKRVRTECKNCQAIGTITNMAPFLGNELPLDTVKAIFNLAGIKIVGTPRKLTNGYWGEGHHPWWFVKTEFGYIEIGWRKRVMSIDWEDCGLRHIVTADDVTKGETYVHAYSSDDAVKYLRELGMFMKSAEAAI